MAKLVIEGLMHELVIETTDFSDEMPFKMTLKGMRGSDREEICILYHGDPDKIIQFFKDNS